MKIFDIWLIITSLKYYAHCHSVYIVLPPIAFDMNNKYTITKIVCSNALILLGANQNFTSTFFYQVDRATQ